MKRTRFFAVAILCLPLVAACRPDAQEPAPFCDVIEELRNLAPSGELRITAEFVPNTPHRAFLTDPGCRSSIVPVAFPDRSRLEAFFDEAYAGGGMATRVWVDATVRAEPTTPREGQGVRLAIDRVHGFKDVSVIRAPRPVEPIRVHVSNLVAAESTLDGRSIILGDACLVANRHGMTAEGCGMDGGPPLALIFPDDFPDTEQKSLYIAASHEFIRTGKYLRADVAGTYRRSEGRPVGRLVVSRVTLASAAGSSVEE